jgi:hypothetical protein
MPRLWRFDWEHPRQVFQDFSHCNVPVVFSLAIEITSKIWVRSAKTGLAASNIFAGNGIAHRQPPKPNPAAHQMIESSPTMAPGIARSKRKAPAR